MIRAEQFDPEELLKRDGVMSVIAMTGAGKSVFIIDCLSKIYKNYDHVFMISKTAKLQKCYSFFDKECIIDKFDEVFLKEIWENNTQKVLSGKKPERILLIFDDVLNDRKVRKSTVLDDLYTGGRHVGISMWCLSHNFTTLKPLQRNNTSWFVSFDIDSHKERENLTSQYINVDSKQEAMQIFKDIVREKPYQCIIIISHKNGSENKSKIKKYIANPSPNPFRIEYKYKNDNTVNIIKTSRRKTREM
jgi:hypothetical protein